MSASGDPVSTSRPMHTPSSTVGHRAAGAGFAAPGGEAVRGTAIRCNATSIHGTRLAPWTRSMWTSWALMNPPTVNDRLPRKAAPTDRLDRRRKT